MQIEKAMILAAGLGTRMQPLTLKIPKPLIKIGEHNLLERSINLLINNGIKELVINVHHLAEQIENFIKNKNLKIKISNESKELLNTGGGVLKGTEDFGNDPFVVINPDTLWNKSYSQDLKNLIKLYLEEKKPCMLVVNKNLSFDKSFRGDFTLTDRVISKEKNNEFIYTGLQILDRSVFLNETRKVFSMSEIWNNLINNKKLAGIESLQNFYHLNTVEMYNKIFNSKIID